MPIKWKDIKKKLSPEAETVAEAIEVPIKSFKELKYVDPADINETDALLPCMEGSAAGALWHDSITGQCERCGKTIHWATSAPVRASKQCRACAYRRIMKQGDKAPDSISCSDTTMEEFCAHFGVQDCPEVRQMVADMAKQNYMNWLREGLDK